MSNFAIPGLMELVTPESDRLRKHLRLAPHYIQNTNWSGIPSIGPITPGGVQPAFNLVSARMIFGRVLPICGPVFVLSTSPADGDGSVIIDDAAAWRLHVPVQPLPLALGNYSWELHTTDSEGVNSVFYIGTQLVTS
jgi:hypothetical protein